MKTVMMMFLTIIGLMIGSCPEIGMAASLTLTLPQGAPGQQVIASIGFQDIQDMASFQLELDYSQGSILSADRSRFIRNPGFYPELSIGGQEVNFEKTVYPGKMLLIGLSPNLQAVSFLIGELPLYVSESTQDWDKHAVTLSGKIYTHSGTEALLSPIAKTFSVSEIVDTDQDGMDDEWELWYFGNLNRDGTGDHDQDGISDLREYLNGTDPTTPVEKGDVNGDGVIGLHDALLALQIASGMTPPVVYSKADTNADGKIGIEDAVCVLQVAAGIRK